MSTTWDTVDDMILRMLDDATGDEFVEELRIDSWNWAQRHFVHHTPRQRIQTGLVMESDGRTVVLPSDYYEMGRLYDPIDNKWWRLQQWQPGDMYDQSWEHANFTIWGGILYLHDDVSSDNSFELWYYAYWPDVEYRIESSAVVITEDKILTPRWSEAALVHLSAAFCLQPSAVEAAKLRQWNIKMDSGRPTDNSRAAQSRELLWWYNALVGMYPPLDRGGH